VTVTLQLCLNMRQTASMISVDWLSVYQDFPAGSVPVLGSSLILEVDNKGELKKEYLKSHRHEGSYSTSITVRSDGTRVSISGNPSKFSRLDNVFGVSSVSAALDVFNTILRAVGLPELGLDLPPTYPSRFQVQSSDAVVLDRPVITRVDLCQNFALGDSVYSFMDWVVQQRINGKEGHRYANGATVDWNRGSRYTYFKYYVKAVELLKHRKKATSSEDQKYFDKLVRWCESVGLVRFEVALKSMALKRDGLDIVGNWTGEIMGQVIEKYAAHFRFNGKGGAKGHPLDRVVSDLVDQGVPLGLARRCHMVARAWLSGSNIQADMSRASFYRVRRPLLGIGIDIGLRCDVRTLLPQVREFSVQSVNPPEFYRTGSF